MKVTYETSIKANEYLRYRSRDLLHTILEDDEFRAKLNTVVTIGDPGELPCMVISGDDIEGGYSLPPWASAETFVGLLDDFIHATNTCNELKKQFTRIEDAVAHISVDTEHPDERVISVWFTEAKD